MAKLVISGGLVRRALLLFLSSATIGGESCTATSPSTRRACGSSSSYGKRFRSSWFLDFSSSMEMRNGLEVPAAVQSMGIRPVRTWFESAWQNGVAERWVESCRRDLLDHRMPERAGPNSSLIYMPDPFAATAATNNLGVGGRIPGLIRASYANVTTGRSTTDRGSKKRVWCGALYLPAVLYHEAIMRIR